MKTTATSLFLITGQAACAVIVAEDRHHARAVFHDLVRGTIKRVNHLGTCPPSAPRVVLSHALTP